MLALMLMLAAAPALETLLTEAIRFPTVAGNEQARRNQQAWLLRTAASLGLQAREAGLVTEIDLPGPPGAPVLGLVVHGDVQPVDEHWSVPPFAGVVRDGKVWGRGAADDKGPMVQALLAMHALRGEKLTHTIRLLVGSDEESNNTDINSYLAAHAPPDYSLVLDSAFPVVVGEKAWDGLQVTASDEGVDDLAAGLAPSIVPDQARVALRGPIDPAKLGKADEGTTVEVKKRGELTDVVVHGRAAHAGVNIEGGRNALVSLAHVVKPVMPDCPAADLLAFAAHVRELSLPADDGWGGWAINPATVKHADHTLTLVVNLRRPPPLTGEQSQARLFDDVKRFSQRLTPGVFYFSDTPLAFDRNGKLVRRLMADYQQATGTKEPPAISGGGTYAKRLPDSIAFGMWFPGKPYPGHDVDEQIPLADLQRGLDVLLVALRDIAEGPRIVEPFKP
ncbi:MAG TPA: M20/M25/M40 family metallo-hydrolase [Myxococcales bacterium]|nr:M20/M25/M40 family metallo-hydrolase [Myxococcales bacterium]